MNRRLVVLLLLFDVNWALAVFGQADTLWWQAMVTLAMWLSADGWRRLGSAIALLGIGLDAVLIQQQVLSLSGSPVAMPMHLALLWLGFGLSLAACQPRLPKSTWALALLGGVMGSVGYYLGERFGALELAPTTSLGVVIIGLCWALLFPLGRALITALAPDSLGGKP